MILYNTSQNNMHAVSCFFFFLWLCCGMALVKFTHIFLVVPHWHRNSNCLSRKHMGTFISWRQWKRYITTAKHNKTVCTYNGVYCIFFSNSNTCQIPDMWNNQSQWRHDGLGGVSNQQPHHCLLSRLSGRRSKKISKLRGTGLCAGNSPGTSEFPAQRDSNAENVSIWWRHHALLLL